MPAVAMDIFPTLSEIIEEPLPSDRIYDGVSLVPLFDQLPINRAADEPFYYYNAENLQAVRKGDWKLHLFRTNNQIPWWDKQKTAATRSQRLYNIANDPGETTDLSSDSANNTIINELLALAAARRITLGEFNSPGTEQRAVGSLFPNVPVVTDPDDWDNFTNAEKGDGRTYFNTELPDSFAGDATVNISLVGDGSGYDESGVTAQGYRSTNIPKNFDIAYKTAPDKSPLI